MHDSNAHPALPHLHCAATHGKHSPEQSCFGTVQQHLLQCLLPHSACNTIHLRLVLHAVPAAPVTRELVWRRQQQQPDQQAAARLWIAQVSCLLQQCQQLSSPLWQQPFARAAGLGQLRQQLCQQPPAAEFSLSSTAPVLLRPAAAASEADPLHV